MRDIPFLVLSAMLGIPAIAVAISCGHGGTVCNIVDVAAAACSMTPIRYMGPDGVVREEQVPREELVSVAERQRLEREKALEQRK